MRNQRMIIGLESARKTGIVALLAALVVVSGSVAWAQPADERLVEIRAGLEEAFETLPLSDGWLLRPLAGDAAFRTVEVTGAELAIDGTLVSNDELRARLGDLAEPVIRFARLDPDERALAFVDGSDLGADTSLAMTEAEGDEVEESPPPRDERRRHRDRRKVNRTDAQVVVGSSVTIEEDEVAQDVLVVGGSLTVYGLVKGDAVAIGGSVEVNGEVTGDVAAIGASVDLESEARVRGDVVSIGGTVNQEPGAILEGTIQEVPFLPSFRIGGWGGSGVKAWHGPDVSVDISPVRGAFGFAWELFGVAVLVLLAALTLLVAKRPVERVGEQVASEPWKSGLVGLLCQILFFPLLVLLILILVVSIVGIPFLLLLPFLLLGLLLICLMGYTAVALRVGQWSEKRFGWTFASPFLVLLVGIGLLEIWSLAAQLLGMGPGPIKFFAVMFAIFGALVCYAAWTIGFGGAVLSRFGSTPRWSGGGGEPSANWESPVRDDASRLASRSEVDSFSDDFEAPASEDWPSEGPDEPQAPSDE